MRTTQFVFTAATALTLTTSAFAYEADVDSAWIASQNHGSTEFNDGNNEPNPDCIGDGCGMATVETSESNTPEQVAEAPADSSESKPCAEADSLKAGCEAKSEDAAKKSVTYNEDNDAIYVNENKEIYRARKEGFYTSIALGIRVAGGVNLLFGEKADTWGLGYLGNGGMLVKIPFGVQSFRFITGLDFSYRRYLHEESNEISDNEAYIEMYMFEIPFMFRYIGDDDGFFIGIGGDVGLKLTGFSQFKQESYVEGKKQKDKRDKTIPTNGVELGAVIDMGFMIDSHFGIDVRVVQYFTNLVDEDNLAESTLFDSELMPLNITLGVFYQF